MFISYSFSIATIMILELLPSRIILSSELAWPRLGNGFLVLSVINSVAILLFSFAGDYDMAQKLNLETNTLIMKTLMGSMNIGKS